MADLQTRFATLDRVAAPDLWDDIRHRADASAAGVSSVVVGRPTTRPVDDGERRTPALVWIGLTFVLMVAVALGGFLVGAFKLPTVVPTIVPSNSPTAPTTLAPSQQAGSYSCGADVTLIDDTGLANACTATIGTGSTEGLDDTDLLLTNRVGNDSALVVSWLLERCDIGARLQFQSTEDGYRLSLTRSREGLCAPARGLVVAQIDVAQPILANVVTTEVMPPTTPTTPRPEAPSPSATLPSGSPAPGEMVDCPGATAEADIVDTYVDGNATASWAAARPDTTLQRSNGQLAAIATDLAGWPGPSVVLLDTEGGECRLASFADNRYIGGLSWAPGGDALAISTSRSDALLAEVYVWSSTGISRVWEGNDSYSVAWSPDAQSLALGGSSLTMPILHANGSAGKVTQFPGGQPMWSPDGSQVAYGRADRSDPSRQDLQLYIVDASSLEPIATIPLGRGQAVDWMDDGRFAVLDASRETLYPVAVDGSRGPAFAEFAAGSIFTPDLLQAAKLQSPAAVQVQDPDGTSERWVSSEEFSADVMFDGFAWSPDGDRLAISAYDTARGSSGPLGILISRNENLERLTDSTFSLPGPNVGGVDMGAWQPIWR